MVAVLSLKPNQFWKEKKRESSITKRHQSGIKIVKSILRGNEENFKRKGKMMMGLGGGLEMWLTITAMIRCFVVSNTDKIPP